MSVSNYSQLAARASLNIRPFTSHVDETKLEHFKQLLKLSTVAPPIFENTRSDRKYGLQRDWLVEAKRSWLEKFDWREHEARFNSFPNFVTSVKDSNGNDIDIQFTALFSERQDAIPMALLHGWPSSNWEFLDILTSLKERYTSQDLPYHIIVPALPGYAYSSTLPKDTDFGIEQAAAVINDLMVGLGFGDGYLTQGGDLGSFVSRVLVMKYEACRGMHVNMMTLPPLDKEDIMNDEDGRMVVDKAKEMVDTGMAFVLEQGTRPATLGFALSSSPLALLSWIGEKMLAWTDEDPPLETILETVTLYWFTDTMPRAMWHNRDMLTADTNPKMANLSVLTSLSNVQLPYIEKPCGYSHFAHEIIPVPRTWSTKVCNLVSYSYHDRGGHFAAIEKPEELLADVEDYVKKAWKK